MIAFEAANGEPLHVRADSIVAVIGDYDHAGLPLTSLLLASGLDIELRETHAAVVAKIVAANRLTAALEPGA